jgi:hypothetical protein
MRFPADRTMISLAALDNASDGKATSDGRQFAAVQLTDDQLGLWEIAPAELDTLEAMGWVDLLPPAPDEDDDRPRVAVTEKGRYALTKWIRSNRRRIPQLTREHCGPLGE